jgi:hypothetical protein
VDRISRKQRGLLETLSHIAACSIQRPTDNGPSEAHYMSKEKALLLHATFRLLGVRIQIHHQLWDGFGVHS